jgi:hypothetical protein
MPTTFDFYGAVFEALKEGAFGSVVTIGLLYWFLNKPISKAFFKFSKCLDRLEEYLEDRSTLDQQLMEALYHHNHNLDSDVTGYKLSDKSRGKGPTLPDESNVDK